MSGLFFQHKFKCISCGLHFIVCSDFQEWPELGTTREVKTGEATGLVFCPECGHTGIKLHWIEETDGFIFQHVPGTAEFLSIRQQDRLDEI